MILFVLTVLAGLIIVFELFITNPLLKLFAILFSMALVGFILSKEE